MPDPQPGLLILGSFIPTWPAFFEAASKREIPLFSTRDPQGHQASLEFEARYCVENLPFTPHNFENIDAIVDAIEELHSRHPLGGIVSTSDTATAVLARATERLGLPGPGRQIEALCYKNTMRAALEAAGLPSARSITTSSEAEARQAAEEIGYPVILKPALGAGSVGVTLVQNPEELLRAIELTRKASETVNGPADVLVEEFLSGPQVSVESVTFEGETIWQNSCLVPQDMSGPHFAVMEGITPAPLDRGVLDELYEINAQVNGAFRTHGVTHNEYRLTQPGWRVIEVNPRAPGHIIPALYKQGHGVDLIDVTIGCSMGEYPELAPRDPGSFLGYRCMTAPPGFFERIDNLDEARAVPGITDVVVNGMPGQSTTLMPPFEVQISPGFVSGRGATVQQLRAALRQACNTAQVVVTPDEPAPTTSATKAQALTKPVVGPRPGSRKPPSM